MRQLWQCENCGLVSTDEKAVSIHELACVKYKVGDEIEINIDRTKTWKNDHWEEAVIKEVLPLEFSGKRILKVLGMKFPYSFIYSHVEIGSKVRKVKKSQLRT